MDSQRKALKLSQRTVTTVEYKWEFNNNLADHTTYESPVFPADPLQVASIHWRLKMGTSSKSNQYITVDLYALSKHVSPIRISYCFTMEHVTYGCRASGMQTYNYEIAPGRAGWMKIGGDMCHNSANGMGKLQTILCIIDILDWQTELPADSLFYTKPFGCSCPNFETILATGEDTDITLISKDSVRKINAHKIILKARSPVFKAMLSNEMRESLNKLIVLDDIDGEVLDELVRFIYTGRVSSLSTTADRLLVVADKYEIPALRWLCEKEIGLNLSIENAAQTLVLADMHQASQLKKHALIFITLHAQQVFATDGWHEVKAAICPDLMIDVCESLATMQSPKPQ